MKLRKFSQLTFCANWKKAIIINYYLILAKEHLSQACLSCPAAASLKTHDILERAGL